MNDVKETIVRVGEAAGVKTTQGCLVETKPTLVESIVGFLATSVLGIVAKTILANFLAKKRYLFIDDVTSKPYLVTFRGERFSQKEELEKARIKSVTPSSDGAFHEVHVEGPSGNQTLRVWKTLFMDIDDSMYSDSDSSADVQTVTSAVVRQLAPAGALIV